MMCEYTQEFAKSKEELFFIVELVFESSRETKV